jgi:hypothetical protein
VDDPEKVRAIARSWAISPSGWVESRGRRLIPAYRIELRDSAEIRATYWLGTNANPPRFPCYALCSGWWIAGSDSAGSIDASRFKGLPDAVYFYFLFDLGIH